MIKTVLLEIDPRKIQKKIGKKMEPVTNFCSEHKRGILRFQIGFIIGLQVWFWIDSTFMVISAITGTLVGLSIAIIFFFFKLLGIEDIGLEIVDKFLVFLDNMDGETTSFDLLPTAGNLFVDLLELLTELTRVLTRFGKAIFVNFTILFPILLDIKIDIDWLHVSFSYLIRTLFNIIQFFAVYYFYRKIKARLRARIKDEIKMKKYVFFGE